jgi:hypothetical protein
MSRSNEIALTVPARGVFHEGYISGTAFPGMVGAIVPGGPVNGGRPTWKAFDGTDAAKCLVAIFLPDFLQGRDKDHEYADGERCFLYCPAPGEEINCRVDTPVGTGTFADIDVGTFLRVGSGGMFEVTATAAEAVFAVSEQFADDAEEVNGTVQAIFIGA